ncbi:hypothetical protein RFI_02568, partial [Reticulomyxa filosa]
MVLKLYHIHMIKQSEYVMYYQENSFNYCKDIQRKQLQLLQGHSGRMNKVQFSSDGSKLVSYSYDGILQIWDISSGRQIQLLNTISDAQLLSDGYRIIFYSDNAIRLWDALSNKQIQIFEERVDGAHEIQISADDSKFLLYSWSDTMQVWDISSGKQLFSYKVSERLANVIFSPDGTTIVSSLDDKTIK